MEFLLLRSHIEDDDAEDEEAAGAGQIAVATITTEELGTISISAIRLKRKLPGWLEKSNNRVFHAVNGQVQFKQTRGYLSQSCGLPALKDRVVVIVDASDLSFEAHNEVWKGDREHIRNTIVGERYQDSITAAIKESKALQGLQNEVAREELQQAAKSERNDLFQKLVDADRNLAALLTNRDPVITLPSAGSGAKGDDEGSGQYEGKYSPTYLRLESKVISVPVNRTRSVTAKTDVENGYLQRADNKGRLLIDPSPYKQFGIRSHLHNGRLTLFLEPVEDAVGVGDMFVLTIGLQDDSMPAPAQDTLTVKVVDEDKESKKPRAKKESPGGDAGGRRDGKGPPAPTHGLPPYLLLTKDGRSVGHQETQPWPDGFTEVDGGLIEDLGGQGVVYKINYDNAYHLKYRMNARGDVARDVMTEKYILGMRILMLGYEHALRAVRESKGVSETGLSEFIDDFRRTAARGAASTVLALAENLPKIVDRSSIAAVQDVE
jgi:hypothetical protein